MSENVRSGISSKLQVVGKTTCALKGRLEAQHTHLFQRMNRSTPRFSRCSLSPFLLVLLVLAAIFVAHPLILPSTNLSHIGVPFTVQSQISNLQAEMGSLLKDMHTETDQTSNSSKHADRILHIAVSLDRLADLVGRLASESPVVDPCDELRIGGGDYVEGSKEGEADGTAREGRTFTSQEAQSYTSSKPNRRGAGAKNFLGVDAIQPAVGLGCASVPTSIDRYMSYKVNDVCPDDWSDAQKLMLGGCEPLPRRRCFSRSPPHYTKPLSPDSSLWNLPSDSNILWTRYKCKDFSCLLSNGNRGFYKCSDCFNLLKRAGWSTLMISSNTSAEFSIDQVLRLKPGEMRIGLDFSPSTGTFAAIMRERNVTIVTATLNIGAPFNEMIALRGLVPLYVSVGARLPFFDNVLDIVHSNGFLDGWIHLELLQYVLFDWDRVLRPGGLLWVDRFFCAKQDMDIYLQQYERLGYKKHLWRVLPKTDRNGDEIFFSAVLEKPLRN